MTFVQQAHVASPKDDNSLMNCTLLTSSWLTTLAVMERQWNPAMHPPQRRHTDMTVTTSDGVTLAVRVYGTRAARHTVVLLHGLCVTDEVWSLHVEHLLRSHDGDIRIITYDHRGHGRSGRAPARTYRIEQLADDLAVVLSELDVVGPMTLVGHSMGGMVALAYLARPPAERTVDPDGLVLVSTAAGHLAGGGLGRLLDTPGIEALLSVVRRMPVKALDMVAGPLCATLGRVWPAQRAMLAIVAGAVATTPIPTAVGFLPGLRDYDLRPTLGRIRAHTVVVSGGADPLTPATHSYELADAIRSATHIHLPHAGHMLPNELPGTVAEAVRMAMLLCGTAPLADHGRRLRAQGDMNSPDCSESRCCRDCFGLPRLGDPAIRGRGELSCGS